VLEGPRLAWACSVPLRYRSLVALIPGPFPFVCPYLLPRSSDDVHATRYGRGGGTAVPGDYGVRVFDWKVRPLSQLRPLQPLICPPPRGESCSNNQVRIHWFVREEPFIYSILPCPRFSGDADPNSRVIPLPAVRSRKVLLFSPSYLDRD